MLPTVPEDLTLEAYGGKLSPRYELLLEELLSVRLMGFGKRRSGPAEGSDAATLEKEKFAESDVTAGRCTRLVVLLYGYP